MKFKILKGTETFNKLTELQQKIVACSAEAKAIADAQGATGYAGGSQVGGGIRALCFATKPEGYKMVQQPNYYFPKAIKANSGLLDAIAALPQVKNDELNVLLGYKFQTIVEEDRMYWSSRPGVIWGEEQHLVDTGRGKVTPTPDMIEILESEYLVLGGK